MRLTTLVLFADQESPQRARTVMLQPLVSWQLRSIIWGNSGGILRSLHAPYQLIQTAVGPVDPVGGPCPSKEVWETLR